MSVRDRFNLAVHRCIVLRDLQSFVQFKKNREKHPWRSVTFINPATLLKAALLHGCFSRFSNCKNGAKWRKTTQMVIYKLLSREVNA